MRIAGTGSCRAMMVLALEADELHLSLLETLVLPGLPVLNGDRAVPSDPHLNETLAGKIHRAITEVLSSACRDQSNDNADPSHQRTTLTVALGRTDLPFA
jgi:hypothetical protein